MTAKEFFDLVSDMRSKQREYFRTRSTSVLNEIMNDNKEDKLF